MKASLCFCIVLVWCWGTAQAQDEPYETIFQRRANRRTWAVKGYGALLTEFSPGVGSTGVRSFLSTGVEGGIIINRRLRIGLYAMSSVAPEDILRMNPYAAQDGLTNYAQSGGTFDWLLRSEKPLHYTVGLRVGGSDLALTYLDSPSGNNEVILKSGWHVSPHADAQANLRPWLRVNLGVGYRFAFGPNTDLVQFRRDFSSPLLHVGIQFGNFK